MGHCMGKPTPDRCELDFSKKFHTWEFVYGEEDPESQFIRLHVPRYETADSYECPKLPVIVLLHGGFWRKKYNIREGNTTLERLVPAFIEKGLTSQLPLCVVEVEYRRVGERGVIPDEQEEDLTEGGWPQTNADIVNAFKHLYSLAASGEPLDLERVVFVGHSAGGHLALWASEHLSRLKEENRLVYAQASGGKIRCRCGAPILCVALAPVCDILQGYIELLGDDGAACRNFMKMDPDSDRAKARYRLASPSTFLPNKVPQVIVVGEKDADVPVSHCDVYIQRAQSAGGELEVARLNNAHHFDLTNPEKESFKIIWGKVSNAIRQSAAGPSKPPPPPPLPRTVPSSKRGPIGPSLGSPTVAAAGSPSAAATAALSSLTRTGGIRDPERETHNHSTADRGGPSGPSAVGRTLQPLRGLPSNPDVSDAPPSPDRLSPSPGRKGGGEFDANGHTAQKPASGDVPQETAREAHVGAPPLGPRVTGT
uniref:BD-FAE-like domain-containing protein n=1 Tax=Chromera velia CCMP2878 TaxID=1169474 RepID=A0A0G4GNZ9_9ALVE|eukprot:Cvel_22746.t1-p1 / transcript=Cvel_22746.t1 / gene=Cvel_22746 / organism=Chromera_velia_CCMP2878 / gene_product=hypothetical protein / transcript_product=hypothetical protein / location=Cvel_scaffold2269:21583-27788(+) / protein_length=481 / sequence_SO=supercontig / SO=protein_coding / is_pseudo=false